MEYKCGCKTFIDPYVASLGYQIDYCPKHKAAPELYEALKDMVDPNDCSLDHHGHCQEHGWLQSGLCPHFRAKIALAKGGGK